MIDADTEKDMLNASLWLDENKIGHSIIASSQKDVKALPPSPKSYNKGTRDYCPNPNGGFWIIIDRPGRWSTVENYLDIPGQDSDYLRFSKHRKICYLRAEMKTEFFIPVVIKESGSELVDNFAKEVIEHFSSKAVKWMWRLESYRSDRVDLTNPNEFDVGLTLDEVLA